MQEPATGTPGQNEVGRAEAKTGPTSVAELFRDHETALLVYARQIVGDSETAEDMVQEAFIKLHRVFGEVRQPRPWLYRTVHNLAMNQLRSRRKIVPMQTLEDEGQQWPDAQPLPDDQIARLEAIGQTRLSLETLDARSRELIRLKFEEGLSYRKIAQHANLSVSNVGYILHHALKQVGAELKKLGFVP